jgi:Fe-S cluster assembly iron-binding protein IscA
MIITNSAKDYIVRMMREAGASILRITMNKQSCCGPSYQLSLDEPKETETVTIINGVKVSMDIAVLGLGRELTLDLVEDEQGSGLVVSDVANKGCC